MNKIPYGRQNIDQNDIDAVVSLFNLITLHKAQRLESLNQNLLNMLELTMP